MILLPSPISSCFKNIAIMHASIHAFQVIFSYAWIIYVSQNLNDDLKQCGNSWLFLKQWAYGLKMVWLRYTTTYSGLKTFYVELLNEQKIYCTSEISLRVFVRRHIMDPHHLLLLKYTFWKYEIYQCDFNYILDVFKLSN